MHTLIHTLYCTSDESAGRQGRPTLSMSCLRGEGQGRLPQVAALREVALRRGGKIKAGTGRHWPVPCPTGALGPRRCGTHGRRPIASARERPSPCLRRHARNGPRPAAGDVGRGPGRPRSVGGPIRVAHVRWGLASAPPERRDVAFVPMPASVTSPLPPSPARSRDPSARRSCR